MSQVTSATPRARAYERVVDRAIQVWGAAGVSGDLPLAAMYQGCPYQKLHLNQNLSGCENCYQIDSLKRDGLRSEPQAADSLIEIEKPTIRDPRMTAYLPRRKHFVSRNRIGTNQAARRS